MDEYWKKENIIGIGAGIGSSPKLFDKNLIIGANDSFLYSLTPENGEIVWKFKTNGIVYSTPAVDNDSAYFGSGDGFLYAVDKKGSMKWGFNSSGRIMSSPVIGKNILAFGNDEGTFFVLDKNGNLLWKNQTGAAIRTTASLINDKIIFGSHDSFLYCFDYDGKQLWKFQTGGPMWTCPCIVDNNGDLLWSVSSQNVEKSDNYKIYFGGFDGGMYCLDEMGKFVWKFSTRGPNTSGPEYENGMLYFGSSDGNMYCIDSDSSLKWKFRTIGRIGHASPLITKSNVFIPDFIFDKVYAGGNMYCLDKNGSSLWRFKSNNAIVSTPIIIKGVLYFGSYDGYFYAISLEKADLLWKFRTLFEKMNFDIKRSIEEMEVQEEKTKRVTSVWKPETPTGKNTGITEAPCITNTTLYGSKQDSQRFSYSPAYSQKEPYARKKSKYE